MLRLFGLLVLTLLMAFSYAEFNLQLEIKSHNEISNKGYPEHLTGTFTGGFGEETCRSCHFDYDLNPDGGSLFVSGIPAELSAGELIDITITVERDEMGAAGFQLSARYEDGLQAGKFKVGDNDRIMFSDAAPDSLQYIQHSNKGTNPSAENKTSWTVRWQAPNSIEGPVTFSIAANAANGDQSEFGDYVYAKEFQVSQ
jgi:hypothetical protein